MKVAFDVTPDLRPSTRRSKRSYSPDFVPGVVAALDLLGLTVAAVIGRLALPAEAVFGPRLQLFCFVFVAVVTYVLHERSGLYGMNAIMVPFARIGRLLVNVLTAFAFFLCAVLLLDIPGDHRLAWGVFLGAAAATALATRIAAFLVLRRLSRDHLIERSMVVLGAADHALRFMERFEASETYFRSVKAVFSPDPAPTHTTIGGAPVLGGIDDLVAYVRREKVDDVVIAMSWSADVDVAALVDRLKILPVNVYLGADLVGYRVSFRPVAAELFDLRLFQIVLKPISGWSAVMKNVVDYTLTMAIIVVIFPLLLLIAVMIKLDSPGPVLFRQQRLGLNNRPFWIYKFRSMYHDRPPETRVVQARRADPRVTRVGRFIRATSFDELPQLFNVLDGTMSLVGPRPHALSHNEEYGELITGYFARHRVKPGITGLAQVKGFRGETPSVELMEARIRHDVYYAENWSLFLDIKILVMTALVVVFQRNAY